MREPLIPNLIAQRKNIWKEWLQIDAMLIKRLSYLFKKIGKACNFSFSGWNISNSPEGYYGDLDQIFSNHQINMSKIIFTHGSYEPLNIIINGKTINMKNCVPIRWLFSNFEQELVEGRKLYLVKRARVAARRNHIKLLAKAKLSAKEIKVLGL